MSFWQKLFGSKQKPAQTSVGSTPTRAADAGTSVRPTSHYTLTSQDIEVADDLCKLLHIDVTAKMPNDSIDQIERIGREVYSQGGHQRMLAIHSYVRRSDSRRLVGSRELEMYWDGIGDWRG